MGAALIPILLGVQAVGTVAAVVGASKARKQAKEAQEENKRRQDTILTQQKEFQEETVAEESRIKSTTTQRSARSRQKQIAAQAQGRSGTILTGPLGLQTDAPVANKRLLGR